MTPPKNPKKAAEGPVSGASFTDGQGKRWTACAECDRGGNGNDKDKCSCGWKVTKLNGLGCYLGTGIVGAIKQKQKLTRSQENYRRYLNLDTGLSFGEWMMFGSRP
jgi:hypothetical protein